MKLQAVLVGFLLSLVVNTGAVAQSQSDVRQFQRDCEADDAQACWQLGLAYEYGTHVDADNVEAVHWFRRAAALGSPEAHMSMGVMYYLGHGVPQNDDEAFNWYNAAVQLGFEGARGPLADMYATGRGVEQDLEMAIRVIEPLASSGNEQAQGYLARLRSQAPSELIMVPLDELIVNGAQYHGQEVQTEGVITYEEYGQALFVSERDYTNSIYANSIAISVPPGQMDERENMERTQVRFRGIYDHFCASDFSFCSSYPGQGILNGYVSASGGKPDDGYLPSHGDLITTPLSQLLVADESFEHFDSMVDFAVEIVQAFAEQDQQATVNLFPVSFGEDILEELLAARGRVRTPVQ